MVACVATVNNAVIRSVISALEEKKYGIIFHTVIVWILRIAVISCMEKDMNDE